MAPRRGEPPPAGRGEQGPAASLLDALLADLPVAIILCDRYLAPLRAGAAAAWLLDAGGWARDSGAAAQVQAAAAAALDSGGVTTLAFDAQGRRWEARAAPLPHPPVAVAVVLQSVGHFEAQRDGVLRAAHDMKAPIHALEGFTKLLLREAAGPLTAEQRRFLEVAGSEAARLRTRLERLLDMVRYAEPQPPPAALEAPADGAGNLSGVVEETASRFAGTLSAKRLDLQVAVEPDLRVAMPDDEVSTILENLLSNAIAATPRGGTIRVEAARLPDGRVQCRVADSGPGIPEPALERVFQAYYRLPERSEPGGTGLGLSISQGLAEARHGQLTAANHPGGGAVFTLTLPGIAAGAGGWPVLRLAPVNSHAALAAARTALDVHLPGRWRIAEWDGGVLDVVVQAPPAAAQHAAADIARTTSFACWPLLTAAPAQPTHLPGAPSAALRTGAAAARVPAPPPVQGAGPTVAPEPPEPPEPPEQEQSPGQPAPPAAAAPALPAPSLRSGQALSATEGSAAEGAPAAPLPASNGAAGGSAAGGDTGGAGPRRAPR